MRNLKNSHYTLSLCFIFSLLMACKSGPFNLIKPASPHEQYERKLINSGLNQTTMGIAWINNGQQSFQKALDIKLPYQEKGYFSAEKVEVATFRFKMTKGQKLQVQLTKKPTSGFMIYMDVWQYKENSSFKLLAAADTLNHSIQFDADQTGDYVIRLQPELLGSGSYTLAINTGPSLGYPLKAANRNQIQSLYGVGRDDNTRKHEGIDIFAPYRTPVLAVAPGTVTRVNTNNLGGKVVWFRPEGKNYTLYYAHLDEQTATEGQIVMPGDTLGRMGNTGNARTTPPHLHFGIYTSDGAVDPFPFINPLIPELPKINADITRLNTTMRTVGSSSITGQVLKAGTIIRIGGATENNYRVELPDGQTGYLSSKSLIATSKPLTRYKIKTAQPVYDRPDSLAAVKLDLQAGETIEVLGYYGDYQLMLNTNKQSGWIRK